MSQREMVLLWLLLLHPHLFMEIYRGFLLKSACWNLLVKFKLHAAYSTSSHWRSKRWESCYLQKCHVWRTHTPYTHVNKLLASGEGLSKVYPYFGKNESSISRVFLFGYLPPHICLLYKHPLGLLRSLENTPYLCSISSLCSFWCNRFWLYKICNYSLVQNWCAPHYLFPFPPTTSIPSRTREGFHARGLLGAPASCTLLSPESSLTLVWHVHKVDYPFQSFKQPFQSPKSERDKFIIHLRFTWGTINIRLESSGLEFHGPLSMSPGGKLSIAACELPGDNHSQRGLRKYSPDQTGVAFCLALLLHSPILPSLLWTQFLLALYDLPPVLDSKLPFSYLEWKSGSYTERTADLQWGKPNFKSSCCHS